MDQPSHLGATRGAAQHTGASPGPLSRGRHQPDRAWSSGKHIAPACHVTCVVEFAPGYGCHVPAAGLDISHNFLLRFLPAALVAADRIRPTLNMPPQIERLAPGDVCHCALRWHGGWRLIAHRPVVCGHTTYENGAQLDLHRSTVLTLGVGGWPIAIRIDETYIPL